MCVCGGGGGGVLLLLLLFVVVVVVSGCCCFRHHRLLQKLWVMDSALSCDLTPPLFFASMQWTVSLNRE